MSKKVTSLRGEVVDFDLLTLKQQIAAAQTIDRKSVKTIEQEKEARSGGSKVQQMRDAALKLKQEREKSKAVDKEQTTPKIVLDPDANNAKDNP